MNTSEEWCSLPENGSVFSLSLKSLTSCDGRKLDFSLDHCSLFHLLCVHWVRHSKETLKQDTEVSKMAARRRGASLKMHHLSPVVLFAQWQNRFCCFAPPLFWLFSRSFILLVLSTIVFHSVFGEKPSRAQAEWCFVCWKLCFGLIVWKLTLQAP